MIDQLVAETSYLTTHNTHNRQTNKHPCPRWDSNPRSQQASGLRPTPQTARPLRSARILITVLTIPSKTKPWHYSTAQFRLNVHLLVIMLYNKTKLKTPWPQSARELYRQSGRRRRSAKLVPTFCGQRGVTWSARRVPTAVNLLFSRPGAATFFFIQVAPQLTSRGLSGPRSRPTTTQKIWQSRGSNPGPLYLQSETLTTRPQRRSYNNNNNNNNNNIYLTANWVFTRWQSFLTHIQELEAVLLTFHREGYMRSMQWQLGMFGNHLSNLL